MNLSARGHQQAAVLAKWLNNEPLDAIYASPMKRVQQTLAPFTNNGGSTPVILEDLREMDFGDWTGLNFQEVEKKFGVGAHLWLDQFDQGLIPNAEKSGGCRARVGNSLKTMLAQHPRKRIAVFCHGGVIRMMLGILLDLPLPKTASFEIDYASVTRVDIRPCRTEVQYLNLAPCRATAL